MQEVKYPMQVIQLNDAEDRQFRVLQEHVDGFVAGAAALAEHLKRRQLDELLKARKPEMPQPAPPIPEPPAPDAETGGADHPDPEEEQNHGE